MNGSINCVYKLSTCIICDTFVNQVGYLISKQTLGTKKVSNKEHPLEDSAEEDPDIS
jgi:hypothetical protein